MLGSPAALVGREIAVSRKTRVWHALSGAQRQARLAPHRGVACHWQPARQDRQQAWPGSCWRYVSFTCSPQAVPVPSCAPAYHQVDCLVQHCSLSTSTTQLTLTRPPGRPCSFLRRKAERAQGGSHVSCPRRHASQQGLGGVAAAPGRHGPGEGAHLRTLCGMELTSR